MSDTYHKALVNTVRAPYLGAQVAWKTPGTRQPTRAEQPLVGFYQYQIQRLLDALQDEKPDLVRSERLVRAYPRAVVAVGGPAFKQTRMFTGLPGSPLEPVMVLNLQEPVALTLMRIAREIPDALGSKDQFLENWFLLYGRRALGWRVSAAQDLPPLAQTRLRPLAQTTMTQTRLRPPLALARSPVVDARKLKAQVISPATAPRRKLTTQTIAPAMFQSGTGASVNFSGGLLEPAAVAPAIAPAVAPATAAMAPAPAAYVPSTTAAPACDKDMYGEPMVWNPAKRPKAGCERVLKKLPATYRPPPPPVLRTKRGLGTTNIRALASMFPGLSWYYNWNPTPLMNDQGLVPFVAMKAQGVWPSFDMLNVSSDPHALLYNEPNHKEQANMTPQAAAAQWAQAEDFLVRHPKVRLGSPCPANDGNKHMLDGNPWRWMDEYVKALPPGAWNKIAFVTIHPYGNFRQLKEMVDTAWKKYKKPIWVTEFAAMGGLAAQTQLMREALPYLDSNPHVERYAWFPAGGFTWMSGGEKNPNILTTVEGELTPLGRMYMAGSPQTPKVKAAVKTARARAAADFAAQQAAKAAKEDAAAAAKASQAAAKAAAAAAAAQAAQAAKAAAAQAAAAAKATTAMNDETSPEIGASTAAQLRPVRRMRVYLGLARLPISQIDDFVEGKGWGYVAQNISGLWLNAAHSASPTRPSNSWIGEALSHTSGDVFVIQNVGAAFPPEMSEEGKDFRFMRKGSQWETRQHVPGDGFGRDAGTPVASNNVVLNLRAIAKSGYNARVVGATVVTDYICGHNCLPDEDWQAGDVAIAAAKLAKGLAPEVPGIRPPMYVATRNNWWNPAKGEGVLIQDKLLPIVNSGQGLVYESAPINFVNQNNIPKMNNLLKGFKRAVTWARENNKPLVWLAPKGDTQDYLGTMKRAMELFVKNNCVPDGVVVINYQAGDSADEEFALIPDNRGGEPINTLTGVARFLIGEYGARSSGPGL